MVIARTCTSGFLALFRLKVFGSAPCTSAFPTMPKSGKVLVVDDYEPNLRGLGLLLERAD